MGDLLLNIERLSKNLRYKSGFCVTCSKLIEHNNLNGVCVYLRQRERERRRGTHQLSNTNNLVTPLPQATAVTVKQITNWILQPIHS